MLQSNKTFAVIILMLVFATLFMRNVRSDFPLIFEKNLHAHDESSNSVVAANITRKFFPPMVRVNPLVEEQGNWMEGPYWQHIPPLFAYVPYLFFSIDGQVTIEMKRLSFAFVTLLTGLLFIFGVYRFRKSLWSAGAATIASIFWINTPFTHELITGYAFGVSDVVLAFTVVASFVAILWYLRKEKEERRDYSIWQLAMVGLVVAFPILAKNLLGAIPAATFFILLLRDNIGRADESARYKKILSTGLSFVGLLACYYLSLYFASPETFKNEILISFFHFENLEGWGRPWHYYVTDYLPERYLFGWAWVYYAGVILGAGIGYRVWGSGDRKDKVLLALSGGWFLWNLAAITLVESKIANFIYQSYLLSLFFIVYSLFILVEIITKAHRESLLSWIRLLRQANRLPRNGLVLAILITSVLVTGWQSIRFVQSFNAQRASAYNYQSEQEKFYQAAEGFQEMGLDQNDLVIVRVSDNDCWFRYPVLYLTGAEAKTLLEMHFGFDSNAIKQKYNRMFLVIEKQDSLPKVGDYSYTEFYLRKMEASQIESVVSAYLNIHRQDIEQDILRIKKDKTSCQWLVPDRILNAP